MERWSAKLSDINEVGKSLKDTKPSWFDID